ncbi:MAG: serine protease, partial [Betaproteobacteria bacterium]|nr:serine protease [Betaproteobacteria bacterium]
GYWEYHLDKALYASPPMANHSGAALFNPQGELVGIGSLYMPDVLRESDPRALPGNMFVPSELINSNLTQLLATGSSAESHRPWLGINAVERNGLSLDGEVLTSLASLYKKVWAKPLDAGSFTLTVQDRGRVRDLQLEVRDRSLSIQKPAGI